MSETGTQPLVDAPPGSVLARVNRPVMHRLVGVRNIAPSGWEGRECVLRMDAFKGHPVMGSKLYVVGTPTMGKLVAKSSCM